MRLRAADREKALNLWAAGSTTAEITDALSLDYPDGYEESDVRTTIALGRRKGEARASILHPQGPQSTPWNAEREIKLTALWKAGKSASAIAREIGHGITRNAIIGKAHRMGLGERSQPVRRAPRQRPLSPKRKVPAPAGVLTKGGKVAKIAMARATAVNVKARVNVSNIRAKKETRKLDRPEAFPVTPVAPESVSVTLLELDKHCCHWPVGDAEGSAQLYCGAPKAKDYCAFHEARRKRAGGGRPKGEPTRQSAAMQRNGSWS